MREPRRRSAVLIIVAMAAVPLLVAATAFACARLATLKLDRANARAGTTITAVGRNFNSAANASPVAIRFNSRSGNVLWEGRPDAKGRFRATFKMPSAPRGYYVILATQTVASGAPAAGTPGRAPIRIRSAKASAAAGTAGSGGPGAPPTGTAAALLLAALGAGGLVLTARRRTAGRSIPQLP